LFESIYGSQVSSKDQSFGATFWRLLKQTNETESFLMLPGYVEQYSVKNALNLVVFLQGTSCTVKERLSTEEVKEIHMWLFFVSNNI